MQKYLLAIVVGVTFISTPIHAESIVGMATVIDGDTLEIQGKRIRLFGIDAPESTQLCQDSAARKWRCGQQAALALSDHIARRTVSCEVQDTDRYRRSVAICAVAGEVLNAWMIEKGWALAYRKFSTAYVNAEAIARGAKVGIWAGMFQPPWEWRREH